MIKTLYCGGDSWTEGDELGLPYVHGITDLYMLNNSWPAKLAELLNVSMFVNEGLGGTSNTRIFRKAVKFIREYSKKADTKQLMVVVCWTTLDRDEIPIDLKTDKDWDIPIQQYGVNWPNHSEVNKLDTVTKTALEQIHKPYTITIGNKSRTNLHIERMWQLKQICQSLNVKLVQTFALDIPAFDPNDDRFVKEYQNEIGYLDEIFINYCRKKNYPLAPGGHCYEQGHEGWAKYINEHINNSLL